MPYYLSRYVGLGTEADPCRALGADEPGAAAIDLRADGGATPEGGGLNVCLLYRPTARSLVGLELLADETTERVALATVARLRSALGLPPLEAETFDALVLELMLQPPAHGWKPLIPSRVADEFAVHLGPLRRTQRVLRGGATATDDFNRADETPIGGNWTIVSTDSGAFNLTTNALHRVGAPFAHLIWNAATFSPDQFSEMRLLTFASGDDFGPACRCLSSTSQTYYVASAFASDKQLFKRVAGTLTKIQSVTTSPFVAGDMLRLEAEGSTLRYVKNGTLVTNGTATDTAIAAAGTVGIQANFLVTFDDWSGGDLAGAGGDEWPVRATATGATPAVLHASHY